MKLRRPLLLACLLSACKPSPEPAAEDLRAPLDLASSTDLSDPGPPADLASGPDLLPACGYRQAYSSAQMTCACDSAAGHTVSCSSTFCCSTGQTCLDGDRCSPPAGRRLAAMAYDGKNARTVVFGGDFYDDATMSVKRRDDWWQLDGKTWGPLTLGGTRPVPRHSAAMAFDGAKLVVFGGSTLGAMNQEQFSAETWLLDGKTLTPGPAAGPDGRSGHAMVYDSARGRVVLFGGYNGSLLLDDTWEWNGTAWLEKTTAAAPVPRDAHGMAFDSKRNQVVLFGGTIGVYNYSQETWTYNGTSWSRFTTAAVETPKARSLFAMAYDAGRDRVVMFSGEVPGVSAEPDHWEFDGTRWIKMTPPSQPPPRLGASMIYDPVRKVVLLYGGLVEGSPRYWGNDLWSWDGTSWKQLY